MRKILLFLLLMVSAIPLKSTLNAAETDINMSNSFPIGLNYLDLRYLDHDYRQNVSTFSIPIKVKKGIDYTIITADSFIGRQNGEYSDLLEYKIIEINNKKENISKLTYKMHEGINIYYTTFNANDSLINITNFPALETINDDFMLIEGTITDFAKFESYIGPRDGSNFDGVVFGSPSNKIDLPALRETIFKHNTDLLDIVIKTDNYSEQYQLVGNHVVTFHLRYAKNTVVYNLEIRVVDLESPSIIGPNFLNYSLIDNVTNEGILSNYQFMDNVSNANLTKEIVYNEYNNTGVAGSYEAKIKVTDEFGNVSEKIIVIRVGVSFTQFMEGPARIFMYKNQTPLNEADIINRYIPLAGIDHSKITHQITLNKYNATTTPGTYDVNITFFYQETNNTQVINYVLLKIIVIDQETPTLDLPEMILNLEEANQMTNQAIRDYITNELLKRYPSARNVELLRNEYEMATKEGTYYIYYRFELDESIYSDRLTINVNANKTSINPLIIIIPIVSVLVIGSVIVIIIVKKKRFDSEAKK